MKKFLLVTFVVLFLFVLAGLALAETLRIYFLDVGQGDASLVISSAGEVILIDQKSVTEGSGF
ncbi:hypothetical protein [Candidatus Caldatribacterium saccharofermentans]|uniref:MBL fold metallo-hydrolase n=1 Tax=Candidatus Caldatribacterium saccharofermentans TaxID=1454753 RepID=A0A7V4WME7_9BACT